MNNKSHTIPDFYNYYLTLIEFDTIYQIDYKLYRQIVSDYFMHITEEVLENSKEYKFPCRLGTLCIVKRRPKNFDNKSLRIDYHESKLQNKAVYFINEHSDYYKFRYHWCKKESIILNKTRYQFVATRNNKRRLAQIIKNREHDYITIK